MKVWIDEGCIGCGLCEEICPEVFQVDETASVIEENIPDNEEGIAEALNQLGVYYQDRKEYHFDNSYSPFLIS